MQDQDLLEAYYKKLEHYKERFKIIRTFPFSEIKFDGKAKKVSFKEFFDMFWNEKILISTNYTQAIDEIIEFAAIISFLPENFRFIHLVRTIYLLCYNNCKSKIIKELWLKSNGYIREMSQKIILTSTIIDFFLEKIDLESLLFEFSTSINPPYGEIEFFSIFFNWLLEKNSIVLTIDILKKIMSTKLEKFNDFAQLQSEILKKHNNWIKLLMLNYPKITLNYFLISFNFVNKSNSQIYLMKYFFKVPFFSNFLFYNESVQYFAFFPHGLKSILIDFLNNLQTLDIIEIFYINELTETIFKFHS